jgi:hypothetical protein
VRCDGAFISRRRNEINPFVNTSGRRFEARLKRDLADELSVADPVALNERADPVLADLWNNPKDAAHDKL